MIVAVTGPMASGKNYICSQFEKKGWVSIDCDKVVHAAIVECRDQILEAFSSDASRMNISLLNDDGSINRRALGAIVFSDPELLKKQENIGKNEKEARKRLIFPYRGSILSAIVKPM